MKIFFVRDLQFLIICDLHACVFGSRQIRVKNIHLLGLSKEISLILKALNG